MVEHLETQLLSLSYLGKYCLPCLLGDLGLTLKHYLVLLPATVTRDTFHSLLCAHHSTLAHSILLVFRFIIASYFYTCCFDSFIFSLL